MNNFFSLSMFHIIFGISTQKFIYGLSDTQATGQHIFLVAKFDDPTLLESQTYLQSSTNG